MRRWLWTIPAALAALAVPCGVYAEAPAVKVKPETKAAVKEDKKADAGKPTVPVFRLTGDITEGPAQDNFLFGAGKMSFREVVARLKKAGEDPSVKAVVLLCDGQAFPAAQTEELRQAVPASAPPARTYTPTPTRCRWGSTSSPPGRPGSASCRRPTCGSPA